ncbi:S66 peptidase family protein [Sunxiuqinia sp. A32]|uniref:S66 peptidase family protein n=1 Tax=Sunxiuqinia sp. A32 TaxID=3461496 RepID=UPI0040460834
MTTPPYLQKGDRIRVVSPAGKVNRNKVLPGLELIRNEGFELILGAHTLDSHFQFAGNDEERLEDLQQALDDPECKAIICSRGGYGVIRFADKLDFTNFKKHPKWLVGFSDITVLHCLLQKQGISSIHGAMPAFYTKEDNPTESYTELIRVLTGEKTSTEVPANPNNKKGNATAPIIGGNLSILYSLLGTPYEPDTVGKILFIEDLNEYLYHLDRIMHSLKLAGKLKNLAGLVVGGFSDMKDNDSPFGQSVEEIILNTVKDYNFPVCFDFPAGHIDRNLPIVLGENYLLKVKEKTRLVRI